MNDQAPSPAIRQVLLPVEDLGAALEFYAEALALPLAFRDGDRYAMLDTGAAKLALAAPAERRTEQGAAPAFKVDSVAALSDRLRAAGVTVPEPVFGGHQVTVEIHDPDGHPVLFYEPLG